MHSSLTPEQQIERLKSQIGWATRLSSALTTVGSVDDVVSILLAGLVAPTGLGFSQVLYFACDPESNALAGKYVVYHESQEAYEALRQELEDETTFMESRSSGIYKLNDHDAEDLQVEAQMQWLKTNAQWVTLFQRLNPDNPRSERLARLSFAHSRQEGSRTILDEVALWRCPRIASKTDLGVKLPPGLAALLPESFIIAPIRTQKGLRSVLFADRGLTGVDMTSDDLRDLDWFVRQAALAIENVEVNTDLTHAYHDLKQVDQMKSNFLSIISHELRTPLTAITGFVELILEERVGSINDNQKTLLSRVSKNTGHLNHLVNDLIELAEIEAAGTAEVRLGPVEPLTVLMDTIPKLEQRRRDKKVKIVPMIDDTIPRITCDERALGRIFFHLLDNAVKFSRDNSAVEVRMHRQGQEFHADISDQGVGIAAENIRNIFKQFYQVDNTMTRGHEGLGLGLAVTKMLLKATHGRITVSSEPGQGSVFTVIFPIVEETSGWSV